MPLSFDWDRETLLVATPTASPTGRNLAVTRAARLALGDIRDVSMIDGQVEVVEIDALAGRPGSVLTASRSAAASTLVRRPRRTAGSASPHVASRPGAKRTSWPVVT